MQEENWVVVRSLAGEHIATLSLAKSATVWSVKQRLRDSLHPASVASPYCQQLVFGDQGVLGDDDQLERLPTLQLTEQLELTLLTLPFEASAGSALVEAASQGTQGKVEEALRARADPNFTTPADGTTALHAAALAGHELVIDRLCEVQASVDRTGQTQTSFTRSACCKSCVLFGCC
ncbi:unnamed protein product [Polarella glacialis]|uniref:Uncharacterized protein n=1 Tax=Polarella glacialis TaxID=89957 RepID=A0A813F3F3_POLGL|nr:unnamed protein product [Polarella glacialis]